MIRKIICPTDFSPASQNGVQYAAILAQALEAKLHLVNVQEITPAEARVDRLAGPGPDTTARASEAGKSLERMCLDISTAFRIDATFEVNVSGLSFEKTLGFADTNETLLITGTNGADSLGQRIFGSHSFHFLKNWDGPLLVVPEEARYETIRKIVFAWGYGLDPRYSLRTLRDFTDAFAPLVDVLHLTPPSENTSRAAYNDLRDAVAKDLRPGTNLSFEQVISDHPVGGLEEYMKKTSAHLLAVSHPDSLYSSATLKRLFSHLRFPLLVLPAGKQNSSN
jgi:nucleotide-binding universal stress UspA family protein